MRALLLVGLAVVGCHAEPSGEGEGGSSEGDGGEGEGEGTTGGGEGEGGAGFCLSFTACTGNAFATLDTTQTACAQLSDVSDDLRTCAAATVGCEAGGCYSCLVGSQDCADLLSSNGLFFTCTSQSSATIDCVHAGRVREYCNGTATDCSVCLGGGGCGLAGCPTCP